jgi:hypothetical protein
VVVWHEILEISRLHPQLHAIGTLQSGFADRNIAAVARGDRGEIDAEEIAAATCQQLRTQRPRSARCPSAMPRLRAARPDWLKLFASQAENSKVRRPRFGVDASTASLRDNVDRSEKVTRLQST